MKRASLTIVFLLFFTNAYSDNATKNFNEDPSFILEKAREYVVNKEYAEALKCYIWFFENSTKIDKSLWAVKLSYCLAEWRELGDIYEPGLREFRNNLYARKKRLENGETDVWVFMEFNAFCEKDDKVREAVELFLKFHNGKDREFAKVIFPQIQYELGRMGYYEICNEYIKDPIEVFERIRIFNELDQEAFNRDILFLLTVLKKSNRDKEYRKLKDKLTDNYINNKLKKEINDLESISGGQ